MTNEIIQELVRRAAAEPDFLDRLIADPESVRSSLESPLSGAVLGANRPEDLLSSETLRASCGDAPTCGVTCAHTCSGGYTMSCGGTCGYTCDYTAGRALPVRR